MPEKMYLVCLVPVKSSQRMVVCLMGLVSSHLHSVPLPLSETGEKYTEICEEEELKEQRKGGKGILSVKRTWPLSGILPSTHFVSSN